jgi:hypothetical protein
VRACDCSQLRWLSPLGRRRSPSPARHGSCEQRQAPRRPTSPDGRGDSSAGSSVTGLEGSARSAGLPAGSFPALTLPASSVARLTVCHSPRSSRRIPVSCTAQFAPLSLPPLPLRGKQLIPLPPLCCGGRACPERVRESNGSGRGYWKNRRSGGQGRPPHWEQNPPPARAALAPARRCATRARCAEGKIPGAPLPSALSAKLLSLRFTGPSRAGACSGLRVVALPSVSRARPRTAPKDFERCEFRSGVSRGSCHRCLRLPFPDR